MVRSLVRLSIFTRDLVARACYAHQVSLQAPSATLGCRAPIPSKTKQKLDASSVSIRISRNPPRVTVPSAWDIVTGCEETSRGTEVGARAIGNPRDDRVERGYRIQHT